MPSRREYPDHPLVGAGALVHEQGRVLLVRRRFPPNEGLWAIPGGLVELGETVEEAAVREVGEETGLKIALERLLDVSTEVHIDDSGRRRYHYVLVDYVAARLAGDVVLNGESSEWRWADGDESEGLEMNEVTRKAVRRYFSESDDAAARPGRS